MLETQLTMVAGHNDLTAYAFNADNVKSNDATLPIITDESLRRPGTTHVLAVGVNAYANPQFNLRYAVADAEDFSTELQRQTAARTPGSRVEATVLRDQQATKAAFLAALADLASKSQPEDTVMIFFAGHGVADGQRFYLVPHDLGFTGDRSQLDEAALKTVLTTVSRIESSSTPWPASMPRTWCWSSMPASPARRWRPPSGVAGR